MDQIADANTQTAVGGIDGLKSYHDQIIDVTRRMMLAAESEAHLRMTREQGTFANDTGMQPDYEKRVEHLAKTAKNQRYHADQALTVLINALATGPSGDKQISSLQYIARRIHRDGTYPVETIKPSEWAQYAMESGQDVTDAIEETEGDTTRPNTSGPAPEWSEASGNPLAQEFVPEDQHVFSDDPVRVEVPIEEMTPRQRELVMQQRAHRKASEMKQEIRINPNAFQMPGEQIESAKEAARKYAEGFVMASGGSFLPPPAPTPSDGHGEVNHDAVIGSRRKRLIEALDEAEPQLRQDVFDMAVSFVAARTHRSNGSINLTEFEIAGDRLARSVERWRDDRQHASMLSVWQNRAEHS